MAITIPTADNFQRPTPQSNRPVVGYDPNIVTRSQQNATSIVSNSEQNLAQANEHLAGTVSNEAFQLAAYEKAKIDDTKVQDAINKQDAWDADEQARIAPIKGENFVNATTPVIPDSLDRRKQSVEAINATLTPSQQLAFNKSAGRSGIQFQKSLLSHAIQQHDVYDKQVFDGTNAVQKDIATSNWDHQSILDDASQKIRANVAKAVVKGMLGLEQGKAVTKATLSDLNFNAIDQATTAGKTDRAREILSKASESGEMDTNDMVRANQLIVHQETSVLAKKIGRDVVQSLLTHSNPGQADTAFNVALQTESGGKQFTSDGQVVTSPKGARGIAQIMPATWNEARTLAGLPASASIDNPQDNQAAGKAYFEKQLQDNAGDVQKAWAAYNAGPGALKQALALSAKDGSNWLSHLPQETQDYVAKNSAAYQGGGGKPPEPTLMDIQAAVAARPELQNKPEAMYATQQVAKSVFEEHRQAVSQSQDQMLNDFRTAVEQGKVKSVADFPADQWQALGDKRPAALSYINEWANQSVGKVQRVSDFTSLPIAQQQQAMQADLELMNKGSDPQAEARFKIRAEEHKQVLEEVQKDPLNAALTRNVISNIPPLDMSDLSKVPQQLTLRQADVQRVSAWAGRPVSPLTADEATAFGKTINALPPDAQATALRSLASSVPPPQMMALSKQLGEKDDSLAIASVLASQDTSNNRSVADIYLKGKQALAENRVKIDQQKETGIKAQIAEAIDGVYATPQASKSAQEATYAVYAQLKSEGNDSVRQAVNLVTGGVKQHNGANIAKPYGWSDNKFDDWMKSVAPNSLGFDHFLINGVTVSAEQLAQSLPGARLLPYGDGQYYIQAGSDVVKSHDVVRTPNHQAFILNVGGK